LLQHNAEEAAAMEEQAKADALALEEELQADLVDGSTLPLDDFVGMLNSTDVEDAIEEEVVLEGLYAPDFDMTNSLNLTQNLTFTSVEEEVIEGVEVSPAISDFIAANTAIDIFRVDLEFT
jgi:hypothetical protein